MKQGWIENHQNDLNIEYFTSGDGGNREPTPECKAY